MATWLRALGCIVSVGTLAACSSSAVGTGEVDATSSLALHAEASPLADFKYDTGLLPEGSPAQVQLKLSAGGGLKVDAAADRGPEGVVGKKGGGKLALDLHVKVDGRLKVESTFKSYDGDLPGLKDIDIPIAGSIPFDGLLLADGENAAVTADLPETTLPEIPLGSIPGSLVLTVAKGSTLTSTFHGSCVSVAGGQATYSGESKTNGMLVIKAKIVLKLPVPLNKTVEIPELKVSIPALTTRVEGAAPVPGLADSKQGACGKGPATPAPAQPPPTGGPTGTGGEPDTGAVCPSAAPITAADIDADILWKPPVAFQNVCTQKNIDDLSAAIKNAPAGSNALETIKSAVGASCASCVVSQEGGLTWQVLVEAFGGALDNRTGSCFAQRSGFACGQARFRYESCGLVVCSETECGSVPETIDACYAKARTGACKTLAAAYDAACPNKEVDLAICGNIFGSIATSCSGGPTNTIRLPAP